MADVDQNLKFAPFSLFIEPGFWHNFTKLKLDKFHLSEKAVPIWGSYCNHDSPGLPCRFCLEFCAFERDTSHARESVHTRGSLVNVNILESFRNKDKAALLHSTVSADIWNFILDGSALVDPSSLTSFLLFTFADLKKYHYYYWAAFPAFTYPSQVKLCHKPVSLGNVFSNEMLSNLADEIDNHDSGVSLAYFVISLKDKTSFKSHPLSSYEQLRKEEKDVWLAFTDPCTSPDYPGWPLRNLLTLAAVSWHSSSLHKVICLRYRKFAGRRILEHSLLLEVDLGSEAVPSDQPPSLGWERNERGKMGPRFLDLSKSMDPVRLSEAAVDLNLKLMRWRIVPELDLGLIKHTKCLLLGAGTLGCNVARALLGWGVEKITFVDNGIVSYSNPVRQSLFTFEDTGKHCFKAIQAAQALKIIYPSVDAEGVVLSIPMPGHTVGESQLSQVKDSVLQLSSLIDSHDVIFLLTDSRESRWLATVMGASASKLVMTAALGFDSFVVLRHGMRPVLPEDGPGHLAPEVFQKAKSVRGDHLGCYFCMDVVAPGDSISDRTLDQQCTVTRPGTSMMAAAHVTELLISLLQHPMKGLAPAPLTEVDGLEGVLGPVPHTVRFFLNQWHLITPTTSAFLQCTACSPVVISAYESEGFDFLLKVFNSPSYIEEITGLAEIQQNISTMEIWELSETESE